MTVTFQPKPEIEEKLVKMNDEDKAKFINDALLGHFQAMRYFQGQEKMNNDSRFQKIIKNAKSKANKMREQGITREQSFENLQNIAKKYDLQF